MKIETIQFHHPDDSIEAKIARAEGTIFQLFVNKIPVVVGVSGGKDSGTVASLALNAARRYAEGGGSPFLLMTTSNTRKGRIPRCICIT